MAIVVGAGRWALSRIVQDEGGFSAAAMQQRLAPSIACYYPPMNATKTGYVLPYALVRLIGPFGTPDADTRLLPDLDASLSVLSAAQRTTLRDRVESWLGNYDFTDWNGLLVAKAAFTLGGYTLDTTLRTIIRDVFDYLGHSEYRPRPATQESHNTEYVDNFDDDPTSRWTAESNGLTWDNTNYDIDTNAWDDIGLRYTANGTGSMEHEAQCTSKAAGGWGAGGGARFANDGTNDWYGIAASYLDNIEIYRWNAGTPTWLSYLSGVSFTDGDWYTLRLACAGGNGANVSMSVWLTDHGSSAKPSDPGWIGSDLSPDTTYTDTAANRLDDSSLHLHCGIAGPAAGTGQTHDYFKQRAISDRSGPSYPVGQIIW